MQVLNLLQLRRFKWFMSPLTNNFLEVDRVFLSGNIFCRIVEVLLQLKKQFDDDCFVDIGRFG